ncbi:MAG: phosphopantothenoylcysteine decarboxylase [Candidatus Omnitrophota bacterium]
MNPINIIVTAGPTIEPIDPVRFISNRSTGCMGYKIAEAASRRRHVVTLISGPVSIKPPKVKRFIPIETARDLLCTLKKEIRKADCLIMCAAVGDFRPLNIAKQKIKRKKRLLLHLMPNKDILKKLLRHKGRRLFIGFSLETQGIVKNSYQKLKAKKLDIIVANRLSKSSNVFGDNKLDIFMIDKSGKFEKIKQKTKLYIAHVLLDKIEELWYQRR